MPTLPNMSLITPTLGGDSGTWDDKINAALELVDSHDHTAGKGVQIPISALNINADLPLAGYGVTGLSKATFSAIALPSSGALNLFVSSTDSELYWRSSGGTNVKLTSGASINTTLVGGITGDYSTVGAEIAYDDANKRYTLQTQTDTWARLATGPVRIYEHNTTESVYVEHAVDAALAAPYTVTWPAALPSKSQVMVISAAGAMSFEDPGNLPHGTRTLVLHAAVFEGGPADEYRPDSGIWLLGAGGGASGQASAPLSLYEGQRLTGASVNVSNTNGSLTSVRLQKRDKATGAISIIDSDATATLGDTTISLGSGTPIEELIDPDFMYELFVSNPGAAGTYVRSATITFDHPGV